MKYRKWTHIFGDMTKSIQCNLRNITTGPSHSWFKEVTYRISGKAVFTTRIVNCDR